MSDLVQSYVELFALDGRLMIARNSTAAYQRTSDLFQDRLVHGMASRLEASPASHRSRATSW